MKWLKIIILIISSYFISHYDYDDARNVTWSTKAFALIYSFSIWCFEDYSSRGNCQNVYDCHNLRNTFSIRENHIQGAFEILLDTTPRRLPPLRDLVVTQNMCLFSQQISPKMLSPELKLLIVNRSPVSVNDGINTVSIVLYYVNITRSADFWRGFLESGIQWVWVPPMTSTSYVGHAFGLTRMKYKLKEFKNRVDLNWFSLLTCLFANIHLIVCSRPPRKRLHIFTAINMRV